MTIKVLIIDDSRLVREILTNVINEQPDMKAIGAAPDPLIAREMIRELNPDVLTLDVEMPNMDGITFLKNLMRLRPMPVVMVSAHTERGSEVTFRALELGAVEFVTKPKLHVNAGTDYSNEIAEKIRAAATARIRPPRQETEKREGPAVVKPRRAATASGDLLDHVIVVGASTGGTEAVKEFLEVMPQDCPGILVTQHMPENFTKLFAKRLDGLCQITVKEAEHNEPILPGHAYIAPGGMHLGIKKVAEKQYVAKVVDGPAVNLHKPSVDVLFRSAAKYVGNDAIGIILTGMGKDGAQGMLEMKKAGAYNIAQDEASCVVFGMPGEAIALGAVGDVLPIQDIGKRVLQHLSTRSVRAA